MGKAMQRSVELLGSEVAPAVKKHCMRNTFMGELVAGVWQRSGVCSERDHYSARHLSFATGLLGATPAPFSPRRGAPLSSLTCRRPVPGRAHRTIIMRSLMGTRRAGRPGRIHQGCRRAIVSVLLQELRQSRSEPIVTAAQMPDATGFKTEARPILTAVCGVTGNDRCRWPSRVRGSISIEGHQQEVMP